MNLFSFALIAILIIGIFFSPSFKKYYMFLFTITGIVDLYVLQGNFISINFMQQNFEVDYLVFMHILLAGFSCIALFKYHISKRAIKFLMLFLLSVIMGILLEMLMPFKKPIIATSLYSWDLYYAYGTGKTYAEITIRTAFWCIKLLSYSLAIVVSRYIFTVEDFKKICTTIVNVALFLIPLGFFELLTKSQGSNIVDSFTSAFFGTGYRNEILIRGGYVALKGFSTETGNYAMSLGYLGILLVVESAFNVKRKKIWIILTGIMLIVSMAFTGVYYFSILCFFYFIYNQKKKGKKIPVFGIFIGGLSVLSAIFAAIKFFPDFYMSKRLTDTISQLSYVIKGNTRGYGILTSEMIRLSSLRDELLWFLQRPLFGLGFGTTQCFSGVVSALANIGIVGFFFWWKLTLYEENKAQYKKNLSGAVLAVLIIILMNLLVGNIAMLSSITDFIIIVLLQSSEFSREVKQ